MIKTILQRVGLLVPTLLLGSFLVFMLVHLVPGDPAVELVGEQATVEQIAMFRAQLGLDDPLLVQYWNWLREALQLRFGESLFTHEEVMKAVRRTFPATLYIVTGGLVVSIAVGVPAGVASARRATTTAGQLISSASSLGVAMPSFWLGLILVSVFALRLGWFPATGFVSVTQDPAESLRHLVLPSIAIGLVGAAEVTRQLRAVMIDILNSDNVRTLRSKGLSRHAIVWRHALKNAAVPLLTIVGLQINRFLGATVVIEAVFGISGMGTLAVAAAQKHDLPIVQGVVIVMVLVVVVTNLITDLAYRLFDPRIA